MKREKARLVLADDNEELLAETQKLLSKEFDVVAIARDGLELISVVRATQPDVVVTDAMMPGMNGIEASREIIRAGLCNAIVLLTVYSQREIIDAALGAGISSFVSKLAAGDDLVPAVHAALLGNRFVS